MLPFLELNVIGTKVARYYAVPADVQNSDLPLKDPKVVASADAQRLILDNQLCVANALRWEHWTFMYAQGPRATTPVTKTSGQFRFSDNARIVVFP